MRRKNYSTLDLLEDLRKVIQANSEVLTTLFPSRISRYSDRDLSRLWRDNNYQYIRKIRGKIKLNPNFIFSIEAIMLLKTRLVENFGVKSIICLHIISKYKKNQLTSLIFIEKLKNELARISGNVFLTDEEFSLILGFDKDFIHRTLDTLKNIKSARWYNPHYKFTLERLEQIKENFKVILTNNAEKALDLIKEYITANDDLSYWHPFDYKIENESLFLNLNTIVKAYWYGFLCADGSLEKNRPRFSLELSLKDKDRIIEFCKIAGLDNRRIEEFMKVYRYKGEIKSSFSSRIKFSSEKMAKDLESLGFRGSKNSTIGIPNVIKQVVSKGKQVGLNKKIDWKSTKFGKIALAWLLGFFDGDGTYIGGNQAKIYNSNKKLLDEIRNYYEIVNNVHRQSENDKFYDTDIESKLPIYYLTLGPEIYELMISSYQDSMQRKRPESFF